MPSAVKLNDQFAVQVNASGAERLYNAVFSLSYDAAKLEVVTQVEGTLLKQDGSSASFQAFADKKKGQLWVAQSRVNAAEGANGSGTLATVTFKAIGKGPAPLGFATTTFSTKERGPIPVTAFKSVVEVK